MALISWPEEPAVLEMVMSAAAIVDVSAVISGASNNNIKQRDFDLRSRRSKMRCGNLCFGGPR